MALHLPTLYEHYTSNGITSGLSVDHSYFTLNSKNITLYSGAMHYFRVPKSYWRDRFRKMRAAGLNTVETYIPWNLHEPQIDNFDFGNGNSDMTDFLDLKEYIKLAQEEDLLVIVRPGPYICAEWEFGGLPSWLLRENNLKIRTSDYSFMKHVTRYFARLLPILVALQFTNGGPIVGFQVENEYGSTEWYKNNKTFVPDKEYIRQLKEMMVRHGVKELLFTSDSPVQHGDIGTLSELFQTANFARNATKEFDKLKEYQRNRPTMAMEFWSGWFDHWGEKHNTRNNTEFEAAFEEILAYPASVNLYMFHGGTNWGFLNGANIPADSRTYQPDTTSYDYDAPLTEFGDYTDKYHIVKKLLKKYNRVETKTPQAPVLSPRFKYPSVQITKQLKYHEFVKQLPYVFQKEKVVPMELLPMNNNSGQSYGYVIYQKTLDIPPDSVLKFPGHIHDSLMITIDHDLKSQELKSIDDFNHFGYWRLKDSSIILPESANVTLGIMVTNWGRNNFGRIDQFRQFKGLTDTVLLNDKELTNWHIIPMEFKKTWTQSLVGWGPFAKTNISLCKAEFEIDQISDTFLDMSEWTTGIVIVNGFVLGRYMHLGPQQTLFLPAPLLRKGKNEIVVFEHFTPSTRISFADKPIVK